MDLSAFSADSFQPKDWINNAFKTVDSKDGKEAHAASLVMKLQLVIHEINNSLEETSGQVLATLPRVVRDAESLQQEAILLKTQMEAVKADIAKVEQDTLASMTKLMELDRVKNRVQVTMEALREADNWTSLCSDVEEVFESGDVHAIAQKLEALQLSLSLLGHVSDWSNRVQHLDSLRNRLEALVSPNLVQSFNSCQVDEAKLYLKLFISIDRVEQFIKYYRNFQKGRLLQEWRSTIEAEPDESLSEWIPKYYEFLVTFWYDQLRWCDSLLSEYESSAEILIGVIADALNLADPNFGFCMKAELKQYQDPLPMLLQLKAVSDRLTDVIKQSLKDKKYKVKNTSILEFMKALYSPFVLPISSYAQFESSYLKSTLKVERDPDEEVVHVLNQAAAKLPLLTKEAGARCDTLTNGTAASQLIQAIQTMFGKLNREWQIVLQESQQKKPEGAVEDWALFQNSLTLLQAVGEVLLKVDEMEEIFREFSRKWTRQFSVVDDVLSMLPEDVFVCCFSLILLEEPGRKQLYQIISAIASGEQDVVFPTICSQVNQLVIETRNHTLDTMFLPISVQLSLLPDLEVWGDNKNTAEIAQDLPSFSFQPQEYITQVGELLMTVPQYLEPWLFNSSESGALEAALKHDGDSSSRARVPLSPTGGVTDELLGHLAKKTCQKFSDNILKLEALTVYSTRQLIADIDYLGNILDDLGVGLNESLSSILELLKLNREDYIKKSSSHSPRLVAAIRQMRGITAQ